MRGDAPVATITVLAEITRSPQNSFRGIEVKSTRSTSACSNRVPTRGLFPHVLRELEAVDAVREAGEVLHLARRRELAARERPLEHQRVEARAGRVDRGREAGAAGADDDDVFDGRGGHAGARK